MHGYLAFDDDGQLLVPFRTWRNTSTGPAAAALTEAFGVNIPLRWSIAHLYQAVLDEEPHVADIRSVTTLAGYVHFKLTGRHVLGVGDASGMFPIDDATRGYDARMLAAFDSLANLHLAGLLPEVEHQDAFGAAADQRIAQLGHQEGWHDAGEPRARSDGDPVGILDRRDGLWACRWVKRIELHTDDLTIDRGDL